MPVLKVMDMERSLAFYTDALGFRITDTLMMMDGHISQASVGLESTLIILAQADRMKVVSSASEEPARILGVGIECNIVIPDPAALERFCSNARENGVTLHEISQAELFSGISCRVTDPDGYQLMVAPMLIEKVATVPIAETRRRRIDILKATLKPVVKGSKVVAPRRSVRRTAAQVEESEETS